MTAGPPGRTVAAMHNPLALYALLHPPHLDQQRPRPPRRRGSSARRIAVVTAIVVAALLLLTVVPAAAAPGWYDRADTVGERGVRPGGDIVRVRFGNTPLIKVRFTTRAGGHPWSDPAWRDPDGGTRIVWSLDTDADPQAEYLVRVASTADGPQQYPRLVDAATGESLGCTPEFSYGTNNDYVLGFRRWCIDSPTTLSARVRYHVQPQQGAASADLAPNRGYTPAVRYAGPVGR
jgi:hypothetical protein